MALIALVVIDVVVIAIALSRTSAEPTGSVTVLPGESAPGGEPSLTPVPTPTTSPSPTATPTTSAEPSGPSAGVRLVRWIDAVSPDEVWRATAATCPANSEIERSVDGGATWTLLNSPASVTRLNAQQPDEAFVVGTAGRDCETSFWSTENASTWDEQSGSLSVAWYLEDDGVHSPAGSQDVPCSGPAADLTARTQTEGAVLCSDGSVHSTDDGGEEWAEVGTQPGAVALALADDAYVVAAHGVEDCSGVSIVEVADAPEVRGCAEGADAAPGQVAIAALDDRLWVWTGDQVLASGNGGAEWEDPDARE